MNCAGRGMVVGLVRSKVDSQVRHPLLEVWYLLDALGPFPLIFYFLKKEKNKRKMLH